MSQCGHDLCGTKQESDLNMVVKLTFPPVSVYGYIVGIGHHYLNMCHRLGLMSNLGN